MKAKLALPLVNEEAARFECVWPSCGGGCCKESRPPVSPGEIARIRKVVRRALPLLRPAARTIVARGGWLTKRKKGGRPTLAVSERYCVFYAEGCALHRLGAAEGDKNRYKPGTCITFPLDRDAADRWYVRQWGVENEAWDLPCLDPKASKKKAAETLAEEAVFAARVEAGKERWRR